MIAMVASGTAKVRYRKIAPGIWVMMTGIFRLCVKYLSDNQQNRMTPAVPAKNGIEAVMPILVISKPRALTR